MANKKVLAESEKFRLEVEEQGDRVLIRPVGVVDEEINFTPILDAAEGKGTTKPAIIRFDMGHVTRINSCGVREWIIMIDRVSSQMKCEFENANELFIEQANMVPGMFGRKGSVLHTFQAPYHCVNCNSDVVLTLEPKQVKIVDGQPVAPESKCSRCSRPLEFDWLEEEYFAFVKRI